MSDKAPAGIFLGVDTPSGDEVQIHREKDGLLLVFQEQVPYPESTEYLLSWDQLRNLMEAENALES